MAWNQTRAGSAGANLLNCGKPVIQWIVLGGVIMLTVGAGALSWTHLTHIAAANGHIAPRGILFVFPTIVDGFMVMGSAVVVRHAISDELGVPG